MKKLRWLIMVFAGLLICSSRRNLYAKGACIFHKILFQLFWVCFFVFDIFAREQHPYVPVIGEKGKGSLGGCLLENGCYRANGA